MPDERIFVLVGNAVYSTRRKDAGYEGFSDLNEAYTDLANMKQGLKNALGAQENEIIEMKDVNFA